MKKSKYSMAIDRAIPSHRRALKDAEPRLAAARPSNRSASVLERPALFLAPLLAPPHIGLRSVFIQILFDSIPLFDPKADAAHVRTRHGVPGGGGLPNPRMFPFRSLRFETETYPGGRSEYYGDDGKDMDRPLEAVNITAEDLGAALQYSPNPGLPGLVSQLRYLQPHEHGVSFLLESPTYPGGLAFLRPFGVRMTPVETDGMGMQPESLEKALEASTTAGGKKRVLYVIPTA